MNVLLFPDNYRKKYNHHKRFLIFLISQHKQEILSIPNYIIYNPQYTFNSTNILANHYNIYGISKYYNKDTYNKIAPKIVNKLLKKIFLSNIENDIENYLSIKYNKL
jgi:hypothetical protein